MGGAVVKENGGGVDRTKQSMGHGDSELGHQYASSGARTDYVEET